MNGEVRSRSRWIAAALGALVVALVLAACGSSDDNKSSSSSTSSGGGASTTSNAKKVKLGFVYATTAGNFAQEMALGASSAGKHTPGVQFSQAAPNDANGPQEVQLFQSMIRNAPDGIAMETLTPDLFVRPLKQADDAGVPLVAVDTPAPKGTNVPLFVGNDNYQLGVDLAKAIIPKLPKKSGEILVGTDTPGLIVLELRNKGFIETVKKARDDIKFVTFDSKQSPTANFNTWSSQVKAHPDALAYIGPGTQDAASMAQIQRQTHKKYLVGADDLDPIALQGVKDGYVDTLISPEHWLKGYIALAVLADHAQNGKAIPKGFWNPGDLKVDKSNVDEILARQKNNDSRYAWFKDEVAKQLANPDKYISQLPS